MSLLRERRIRLQLLERRVDALEAALRRAGWVWDEAYGRWEPTLGGRQPPLPQDALPPADPAGECTCPLVAVPHPPHGSRLRA